MSPKDLTSYFTDTCPVMLIGALFTIARKWEQVKCPSLNEWIMEMWNIHTMEYYSATKKSETVKLADKWIELEKIILSEATQTRMANIHVLFLLWFLAPNP